MKSWNEIQKAATAFSKRWKNAYSEKAQEQSFLKEFFAAFSAEMRKAILDCAALDWSKISPAIFGAMFQGVMDEKARHDLGAHYTAEEYILRLIRPLFLDALRAEFDAIAGNVSHAKSAKFAKDFSEGTSRTSRTSRDSKIIYDPDGTPHYVEHINGYLMPAPDVYFTGQSKPRWEVAPPATMGNMPLDGGNLIIEAEDLPKFLDGPSRGFPDIACG